MKRQVQVAQLNRVHFSMIYTTHFFGKGPIITNYVYILKMVLIDLFTDTAAILDSIVSDIYYGMLRGQIHTNLPPEHPIITI